jgi:hypothetical protein
MFKNRQLIQKKCITTIYDKMKAMFERGTDEFLSLLETDGGYIAGSFILLALMNGSWSSNDIDIFIPSKKYRQN